MNSKINKPLGYIQLFIGMAALAGGLPMIISPNGVDLNMTKDILSNTPFQNFLIPGILLFSINGIGSLIASYSSLKLKSTAPYLAIIFGAALIVWITAQFYFLGYASWLQPFYLILGITELTMGFILKKKST